MTSTAALARQAVEAGQGFALSGEQAAVVLRLVTSDRMLDAVLGPPGTGKTTLLRAARTAWESRGLCGGGCGDGGGGGAEPGSRVRDRIADGGAVGAPDPRR